MSTHTTITAADGLPPGEAGDDKARTERTERVKGSKTDVRLMFPQYEDVPGPSSRVFRRNLLQLGAKTDDRGYSLADLHMRRGEDAASPGTDVPGVTHAPAATPQPAGEAAGTQNLKPMPNPASDDELAEAALNAVAKESARLSELAMEEPDAPAETVETARHGRVWAVDPEQSQCSDRRAD